MDTKTIAVYAYPESYMASEIREVYAKELGDNIPDAVVDALRDWHKYAEIKLQATISENGTMIVGAPEAE